MLKEHIGEKVQVYFNLHKHTWSVKSLSSGKVILHCDYIMLKNCIFYVSESGRQRVIREQAKNVHAGVRGTLVDYVLYPSDGVVKPVLNGKKIPITYNPYMYTKFIRKDEPSGQIPLLPSPVVSADWVEMVSYGGGKNAVFGKGVEYGEDMVGAIAPERLSKYAVLKQRLGRIKL